MVLRGVGPPLSGPSGAGSAVYGARPGYCVCGVRGSVGRGIFIIGRVVAPVRRPRVVSGGLWLARIISFPRWGGGGLCARVWGGSVVGYRLVAGAWASPWVCLPRCPFDASLGGPWLAG